MSTIIKAAKKTVKRKFTMTIWFFSVTWQLGLVEREINDILFGATAKQRKTPVRRWTTSGPPGTTGFNADGRPTIQQREIGDDDCCPICQDELLGKHQPVTFCK